MTTVLALFHIVLCSVQKHLVKVCQNHSPSLILIFVFHIVVVLPSSDYQRKLGGKVVVAAPGIRNHICNSETYQ